MNLPKHVTLPDGTTVPVLGFVKDLYRIPGGHIKMSLVKAATEAKPAIDAVESALDTAKTVTEGAKVAIDLLKASGKKGGRPRKNK